jgi:dihydropteroate synthase
VTEPLGGRKVKCRETVIRLSGRTAVMGILNVTPDSFSDGGRYDTSEAAVSRADEMVSGGADIIDIGGESSRPGAGPVDAEEEKCRILPVIEQIAAAHEIPVSVDTRKPGVAEAAVRAGASLINDITGFTDPAMIETAAASGTGIVIMHMQGDPGTMQENPRYDDVVDDIAAFLETRAAACIRAGVQPESIIVDPGIGFGKTVEHNLEILRRAGEFSRLGFPVLIGASRKSFIGKTLGLPVDRRLPADLAVSAVCAMRGIDILRVHDVAETAAALNMVSLLRAGSRDTAA